MKGLADYDPRWEPVRASDTRIFRDSDVLIATDMEGGNGVNPRRLTEGHYAVTLEPEPGSHRFSGYSYYFCMGIQNLREDPQEIIVQLEAHSPGSEQFGRGTRHVVLRHRGRYSQLVPGAIRLVPELDDAVDVTLVLPSASAGPLFASNFHWWPYSEVADYVRRLEQDAHTRVRIIGQSLEGRPLYAVEIGPDDVDLPCVVHAQTPQPSEMLGSLACRALIDWLRSSDSEAVEIRQRLLTCFVPATNPDGSVRGYAVSDSQGRFHYFEANLAAEGDPSATPETAALWRYLCERRPTVFWEWHSNNWARRPGHVLLRYRHSLSLDEHRRRQWDTLEDALLSLPNTHHGNWTSHQEGLYRQSMGFEVTTRLGGMACMIKQHDRFPLDTSQDHAIACMRAAAKTLGAAGVR